MVSGTVIPTMPRQALEAESVAQVTYALMTALPSSSFSDSLQKKTIEMAADVKIRSSFALSMELVSGAGRCILMQGIPF